MDLFCHSPVRRLFFVSLHPAISDEETVFRKAYCVTNERIFTPIFLLLIKWFVDIDLISLPLSHNLHFAAN